MSYGSLVNKLENRRMSAISGLMNGNLTIGEMVKVGYALSAMAAVISLIINASKAAGDLLKQAAK